LITSVGNKESIEPGIDETVVPVGVNEPVVFARPEDALIYKICKNEVVNIEDMQSGISIMDLGLNEFRLDLLEYVKQNGDIDEAVDRDKQRQKLEHEIAALEKKMLHEKQFNRQVEQNMELKRLKKELCRL